MTVDGSVSRVRDAAASLARAGVPSAAHDARVLARHAERSSVDFDELVDARSRRVPLQHLVGTTGFRHLDLLVGPGVFIPRPETEQVVEAALAPLAGVDAPLIVDLCAGSGAIGLSIAHEHSTATVHLVEQSAAAYDWLTRNAATAISSSVAGRVRLHHADLATAPSDLDGTVDVVAANPPYLARDDRDRLAPEVRDHDPAEALWAADRGLAVIRRVCQRALILLRPGGTLVMEHADDQGVSAPEILTMAGLVDVADHLDLAGLPRYATGRRPC